MILTAQEWADEEEALEGYDQAHRDLASEDDIEGIVDLLDADND